MSVLVGTVVTRSPGVVYRNTSGNDMIVCTWGAGTWTSDIEALVGASSPPSAIEARQTPYNATAISAPVVFVVPNGYYYEIVNPPTIGRCIEYQSMGYTFINSGDLGPSGANTRALTTVYHNTTNWAKFVVAQVSGITSGNLTFVSDSGSTPTDTVYRQGVSVNPSTLTAYIMVPSGHYYSLTSGSGTLVRWKEYTWPNINLTKSANLAGSTRLANTAYQNTTIDGIWVSTLWTSNVGNGTHSFKVGPTSTVVDSEWEVSAGAIQCAAVGPVQKSDWYLAKRDTSSTLNFWWEYSFAGPPPTPFRQFVLP